MNQIIKKYLNLNNIQIKKEYDDKINVRCPVCGDSKKSKFKARGWILQNKDKDSIPIYYCHNCDLSTNFAGLLEYVSTESKSQYLQEIKKNKMSSFINKNNDSDLKAFRKEDNKNLITKKFINEVKIGENYYKVINDHINLKKYLANRKLNEFNNQFKYIPEIDAIFCPFYINSGNDIYGYQIRWIQTKRFFNNFFDENPKVWGLDKLENITYGSDIYIFESIFDAMSSGIDNSLALIGSSLTKTALKHLSNFNIVLCLDNDIKGFKSSAKYGRIIKNIKILLHDENFPYKDFNECIMKGVEKEQLQKYIEKNVVIGKLAEMKLRLRGV